MDLGPIKISKKNLPLIVSLLFLSGLWFFVTETTRIVNPLFLPSPVKVATALSGLITNGLSADVFATVGRVAAAFVLSVSLALPVALLMSESKFFQRLFTPYLDFILAHTSNDLSRYPICQNCEKEDYR